MRMIYSPSAVFGEKLEPKDYEIVDDPTEWFAKGWRTYEQYRNGVEPKADAPKAEEPAVEETVVNSAPVETEEAPKRRGRPRRGV